MSVFVLALLVTACASGEQQESDVVSSRNPTEERSARAVKNGEDDPEREVNTRKYEPPLELWENREVPYELDKNLSKRAKSAFRKAARLWTNFTCINITEQPYEGDKGSGENDDKDGEEPDEDDGDYYYEDDFKDENGYENFYDGDEEHVGEDQLMLEENGDGYYGGEEDGDQIDGENVDKYAGSLKVHGGDGCRSYVGKQRLFQEVLRRPQNITLGRKCETIGTAAHELAHALGLIHAHERPDRDDYITVNESNIECALLSQFGKKSNRSNDNYTTTPYDYGSVMQYGTTACENHTSIQCQNRGFAHPRDCSKCICPSGYGGDFCDRRPEICGKEVNATSNWTLLVTANSSAMEFGSQDGYKKCVYWIKAPNGSHVEVRLTKLPANIDKEGCIKGGVEIKAQEDQGLTGYRFCSEKDVNLTLISNTSTLPVLTFMRRRRNDTAIELEYRIANETKNEAK